MDNREIDIKSEGKEAFAKAVELLFDGAPSGKATHWLEHDDTLVLFWHDEENPACSCTKLPYALNAKTAIDFCWNWLQQKDEDQYKEYLDHDGSNGKGFRVFNESWGKVFGHHYSFMGVQAIWAWYGK